MQKGSKWFACIAIGLVMACGGEETATAPVPVPDPGPPLLPETQLTGGCFNWPEEEFTPGSHPTVGTYLNAGDRAIEFTLKDVAGVTHSLSSLLDSRPVLLVFGSFT